MGPQIALSHCSSLQIGLSSYMISISTLNTWNNEITFFLSFSVLFSTSISNVDRTFTDNNSLTKAWAIYLHHQMYICFDVVNPLTQFKWMSMNEKHLFPTYNPNPKEDPDIIEDDEDTTLEEYVLMLLPQCVYQLVDLAHCLCSLGRCILNSHTLGTLSLSPANLWTGRIESWPRYCLGGGGRS